MSTATSPGTLERMEKMSERLVTSRSAPVERSSLPPGPRWHPLLQSIGLMRFRHRFIPWARRKYGEPFTTSVVPENRYLVIFHNPEAVKEIFAGDPEIFHAGKGNSILGPVMGEHSLLLIDSSQHKRARRMLMPAFNASAIRGYRNLVDTIAEAEVGRWSTGVPIHTLERMNALTLEVILQVVFGVTDEARLAKLRPLVNNTVNVSPLVFLGFNVPRLRKYGPWRRALENQIALDHVIYAEIAERRQAADLDERSDVLSRLLCVRDEEHGEAGLTDDELRDQLVTLLLAGHETTATALSWALYELGKDAEQETRAREAALAGDEEYLEAVLKEAMRLHPVIPMVVRHLMEPATIAGVDVPAGANVAASIILAHSDETQHPNHDRFVPQRFIDGEVHPNTWIPFGGGVRRCIGAGFSVMEGVAVLRSVLTAYDVAIPAGSVEKPKVRNITSVPKHGAKIIVSAR